MLSLAFSLCISAVVLTSLSEAIHIRTGNVTTEGEVKTDEGMRYYTTQAVLMKPVVCWEDLAEDGITVDQCNEKTIRYAGNIDGDDFQKGNVVTFPAEDYIDFGCPLPPHRPEEKEPGVIFRIIRSVEIEKGSVTVYTNFIDPGEVVPTIMLHMGPLVESSRQAIGDADLSLSAVSRVNNIGFGSFSRSRTAQLFTGASLAYSMTASGGVCNFEFDLLRRRVTWEQRVEVEGTATLNWSRDFSRSASGEIFKVGIPGAGFSLKIFLLGRVTAGFTAALNWEVNLDAGASATLQFGSRFVVARRVVLGIGTLTNAPIRAFGSNPSASLTFESSQAASATATGFAGIRPILALELEMPVIPDAIIGVGATVGLQASVTAQEPPFLPVTSGRRIGSCSSCHIVQGSLDVEGRRVSITAQAPILGSVEFVLIRNLFSTHIGTLCLFERQCFGPSNAPIQSNAPLFM